MRTSTRLLPLLLSGAVLMLAHAGPARAQLPNFDALTEACKGLYNAYVTAYNEYADYYAVLHAQYPNGDNPPDTADLLGKKIDAMYGAQAAFEGAGCGPIDAWGGRGLKGKKGNAPPPKKIKLKHK